MKKFSMMIGAVAIAGTLAACGESEVAPADSQEEDQESQENTEQQEENQAEAEETEEAEEEAPENETYGLGDAVNFDDTTITLTNVRYTSDEFSDPENDHFIAIELDIENNGEESADISTMLNMSLLSANAYEQDQTVMGDSKGNLDSEIGPGRNLKGEVVFDAEDSEYYEFIFDDPFTSGQAIWEFDKEEIAE
ncbi:DUF4352 domain-containing protein [Alteribacillus sp. JSM 102045]|uniref:DUF4352 domain-containing protein n=1 Tax=Alteribacillus sp. JSM 102045 TaxID=1562101 RepID=UPI0035C015E0